MKDTTKKTVINANHQCPNCNSYYTEELADPGLGAIGVIFLLPFMLNVVIAIIPFLGLFVREYLFGTFIWFIIGMFIVYKIEIPTTKVRCHSCNAVFEVKETSILDKY